MSCIASFPRPTLVCVVQLLRAFRNSQVPIQEISLRVLSLVGGVVSTRSIEAQLQDCPFEDGLMVDAADISDEVWDSVALATSVLSASGITLDDEDISVALEAEGKIIEILLPILLPIAIDLLKAWLRNRQGKRG
jgi:hypothetical protein